LCIATATKLSFRQIFPLFGFLRVLALSCVASLPAFWFKSAVSWPAAARLPVEAFGAGYVRPARHSAGHDPASRLGVSGKLAQAAYAA
jgi:hypothetical protein